MASGSRFGGAAQVAVPVQDSSQLMAASGRSRILLGGALGILLVSLGFVAHGFRVEHRSLQSHAQTIELPASLARLGVESVRWAGPQGQMAGWIYHGRHRAGILLLHGSGGSRADFRAELEILADAGFTVLAMDLGGHGESEGDGRYGGEQRQNVRSALSFLGSQAELAGGRLGALGFSLGGHLLAQVLAEEPRIAALVLSGAPSDLEKHADLEYAHLWPLGRLGVGLAMRFHGLGPDEPRALDSIARDTRPVLFVMGQKDAVVPLELQQELYLASAAPQKSRLILADSAHGDYAATSPLTYGPELISFFSQHLITNLADLAISKGPLSLAGGADANQEQP